MLRFWLLKYSVSLMSGIIMVSKPHIIKLPCNVLLVAGSGFLWVRMKEKSSGFGSRYEVSEI